MITAQQLQQLQDLTTAVSNGVTDVNNHRQALATAAGVLSAAQTQLTSDTQALIFLANTDPLSSAQQQQLATVAAAVQADEVVENSAAQTAATEAAALSASYATLANALSALKSLVDQLQSA